jgi:hypothetical protein
VGLRDGGIAFRPQMEGAMVILQRTDVFRNRIIYYLTLILSLGVIAQAVRTADSLFIALSVAAVPALVLCLIQLYSNPARSHAVIIQREADMIIATNAVHEGFKLRFLRDVLGENVFSFSDEDRERFKDLEKDGYYPAMVVRNIRKLLVLRLCTMMFDDVFCVDNADRWEHYDSSNTSEPTFHKREMPRLREWKGTGA